MPRKLNPQWELATEIAIEMGNETTPNVKRILRELKELRQEQVDQEIAIAAWRWLREVGVPRENGDNFIIKEARLSTVLRGTPSTYLEQFKQYVLKIPPVYLSDEHDDHVRKYATVLKKLGFVYQGWSEEADQWNKRRLTYQEVESLGLLPR